jgi:hypothetical protein
VPRLRLVFAVNDILLNFQSQSAVGGERGGNGAEGSGPVEVREDGHRSGQLVGFTGGQRDKHGR